MSKDHMPRVLTQDIGDADLSYLLYEGEGPPLVLLHATGFLPWLWHPIARKLAPEWRVIAPYFCDHRISDPEKGGLNWLTIAQDLANLCKGLGLEKPAMAGHSMGATIITIANACFGLDARGLVLFEPIFLPENFYKCAGNHRPPPARLKGHTQERQVVRQGRGACLSKIKGPVQELG